VDAVRADVAPFNDAGKTTFLKALSSQLTRSAGKLEGEILYNGDPIDCGKYLVGKITSYVDERDQHAPTLTVRETLEFAWRCTSGGHHSYNIARNERSAEVLNLGDANMIKVRE
jgi:ABC-type multidrug transport system ATPase subunit